MNMVGEIEMAEVIARASRNDGYKKGYEEALKNANMVEQKYYDNVFRALQLACNELSKANLDITNDNVDMLTHKVHGSLVGYFIMQAEKELHKSKKTSIKSKF
jgi:hypothetical protein